MLNHLRIQGFALLDDVELELGDGLNVITGETGAGKSLVVDAVALLRGGRASAEVVRAGADEARIEAVFGVPDGAAGQALIARLERAGLDAPTDEDEGIVVRRVIGKSGRGRVHVNGSLATSVVLADVVGGLIDLAGQHEHQTLVDPSRHLEILDAHGTEPSLLAATAEASERLRQAAEALAAASLDERARAEKEDFLRFQRKELDEAELEVGEDERLKGERERLRAAEKLHAAARRGEEALQGREASIVEELGGLAHELAEVARSDGALAKMAAQIDEARVLLDDAADALRRYADHTHADPARLETVEERLHLVGRLARKHGGSLAAAIARRDELAAELAALESHEERRQSATRALEAARAEAAKAARALTDARRKAAAELAKRVTAALAELGMSGARLLVEVADRAARDGDDPALLFDGKRFGPTGWDRVELLLAANPGEPPRPLARVASGGELSRIMLALKRVLARSDTVATYVFDEVDAGIGGAVADVVGRLLNSVAATKQVLCVTHVPQIAAYGDSHFHVEKRTIEGRTTTVVRRLERGDRVEELARMVGGAKVTTKARAHAEDLIVRAQAR